MRCLAGAAHIDCHPSCSRNHNNWQTNTQAGYETDTKNKLKTETSKISLNRIAHAKREPFAYDVQSWNVTCALCLCLFTYVRDIPFAFISIISFRFIFHFLISSSFYSLKFAKAEHTLTRTSDDKHPTTQQMENGLPLASPSTNNHKFVITCALVCTFTDLNVNTTFKRHSR